MTEQLLPDGLAANVSYDPTGSVTELCYRKESGCSEECTWLQFSREMAIRGQVLSKTDTLSKTTCSPGIGGACSESGGTTQNYSYDAADRLEGPTYDSWGRITSLPAEFAGGKILTTSYFSNDMVATQSQNGITNTFTLDASLRQRSRLQASGRSR